MKKYMILAVFMFAAVLAPVVGQPVPVMPGNTAFPRNPPFAPAPPFAPGNQPPTLTKFSLDFPGGTPDKLVSAIESATGKPLNVIIPNEDVAVQLPPLKMNDVVVPQLFLAIESASRKVVAVSTSGNGSFGSYQQVSIDYGFKTTDNPASDSSIWYFHAEKPSLPELVSARKNLPLLFT